MQRILLRRNIKGLSSGSSRTAPGAISLCKYVVVLVCFRFLFALSVSPASTRRPVRPATATGRTVDGVPRSAVPCARPKLTLEAPAVFVVRGRRR
ncbi:hypothetical protein EVAR_28986_1 [Eumeta japonica]|uniref:Uncharacterized protein n=1 Tax=Eumeta variegata TaxID=151549 RepID=A0A4C1W1Q5_EUMVA|nr:hypothetical protein EVAR_28986_1 [Eumeta japonica]